MILQEFQDKIFISSRWVKNQFAQGFNLLRIKRNRIFVVLRYELDMISGFQGSSGGLMVVMTINFTMKKVCETREKNINRVFLVRNLREVTFIIE
jgi:hypothetical protein